MQRHSVLNMIVNTPLYVAPSTAVMVMNTLLTREGLATMSLPSFDTSLPGVLEHLSGMKDRALISENGKTVLRPNTAFDVQASRFAGSMVKTQDGNWRQVEPYMLTENGVAVISVVGEMVNRGAWVGANSGLTSYEGIGHQFDRAAADSRVKGIVLDMSSPGGEAMGNAELAAKIRAIAGEKPVYAVVNSLAASAGYGAVSGATEIYGTPSSLSGSIGCVMIHMDMTKAAEMKGIEPTLVYAGAHKVDANPLVKLTPTALQELQKGVDAYYGLFVETVAAGRRSKGLSTKAIRDTEARTYLGREALELKLIDGIGTFDQVLEAADKKARRQGGSGRNASQVKGTSQMTSLLLAQPETNPQMQGDANLAFGIMDNATIKANPHLLVPALNLARANPSQTVDAIVAYCAANIQAPQQTVAGPTPLNIPHGFAQAQPAAPQPTPQPAAPQPPINTAGGAIVYAGTTPGIISNGQFVPIQSAMTGSTAAPQPAAPQGAQTHQQGATMPTGAPNEAEIRAARQRWQENPVQQVAGGTVPTQAQQDEAAIQAGWGSAIKAVEASRPYSRQATQQPTWVA